MITVNAETEPFARNDRFISGDGDLDAIISGGSGNAWALTNSNGDLSFASSVAAGGGTSFDVALGDFDGDGDLDALVAKEFGGAAFVMTNDGNGSFTTATLATNVNSTGVAAGDLNGDGRADAIVSASNGLGSQDHTIYLSNASGVLTASGTLPTAINSSEVALGDVDGDGDLDAVISAYDAEPEVWRNDGAGAFTQVSGQQVGAEEWNDVELADFNRDGHLDTVFTHANNGTIVIAYGDGTGVFGAVKTTMALGIGEGRDTDVADLNGDGLVDIYVGGRTNDVALINNGLIDPNTPPSFTGYGFTGGGEAVELGDLDGDGDIDVVQTRDNADVVRVGYNTGNGQVFNFQNENAPSFNLGIFGAALGDVQGARFTNVSHKLDVLANDGNGPSPWLTITGVSATALGNAVSVAPNGKSVIYDASSNSQFQIASAGETFDDNFTYTVTDGINTQTASVTVRLIAVNDTPTDIELSNNSVNELSAGAIIGTLTTTDIDALDNHTYTVSDNRFEVVNGELKLKDGIALDFATAPTVNVTVTSTDSGNASYSEQFTIAVTDVNRAPVDILLSNARVNEIAGGAIVGTLSTVDLDTGDQHSYTVSDSRFEVVNSQLKLKDNVQLDYETEQSVNVTVTSTDNLGASIAEQFTIAVNDAGEPYSVTLSEGGLPAAQVQAHQLDVYPAIPAVFTASYPFGPTLTSDGVPLVYAVTSNNSICRITAHKQGESVFQAVFTISFSSFGVYSVGLFGNIDHFSDSTTLQFTAPDIFGGSTTFTLNIVDGKPGAQNDTAQVVTGDAVLISVLANDGFGADGAHATPIVNVSATNGTAEVTSDNRIRFIADAGYTGAATVTYSVRDGDGDVSAPASVAITVKPVNHAPTDIALSNASVDENAAGAIIGMLSTTDVDGWDSHTYAVNDSRFEVVNGELKLKSGLTLDFEQGSSVNVTVTTTDSEGLSFPKQFAIAVGDVNEAPTDIVWNAAMPSAGDSFPAAGAVIARIWLGSIRTPTTHLPTNSWPEARPTSPSVTEAL